MKSYYVATEVIGVFLRIILIKVHYQGAENCQDPLANIGEIYSILLEYFDLNAIAKDIPNPKSMSNEKNSQIFMFPDYNLFIARCEKEEYCVGRYYDNEEDLLKSEQNVRKSTL